MQRKAHRWLLIAAGLSGVGCSLIVPGVDDFEYSDPDSGVDAAPEDGGMDAALEDAGLPPDDAGLDAAAGDAGPCGVECVGEMPHCDAMSGTCVACTAADHCDDGDFCTADRCGLDFVCRHDVMTSCVAQVEAGSRHSCARFAVGLVRCWGGNSSGQLGIGTFGAGAERPASVIITDAVQLVVGGSHSCVLRSGGGVSCWGSNFFGELGQDPGTTPSSAVPLDLVTGSGVVEVAAGSNHTCVRFEAGTVRCWGERNANGSAGDSFTGVEISAIGDAVVLAAGSTTTCVVRRGGTIACWGRSDLLGDGVGVTSAAPVAVVGLSDAVDVSVGGAQVCALRAGGGVACWGLNGVGQLGDGTLVDSLVPVLAAGLTDAVAISAGGPSCAIRASGQAVCWGANNFGQLGDGMAMTIRGVPGPVNALGDAVYVSAGTIHACARRASGQVVCWGFNADGQLGDGTRETRTTPVDVIF